jgi:hypothetical protein
MARAGGKINRGRGARQTKNPSLGKPPFLSSCPFLFVPSHAPWLAFAYHQEINARTHVEVANRHPVIGPPHLQPGVGRMQGIDLSLQSPPDRLPFPSDGTWRKRDVTGQADAGGSGYS